MNLRRSAIRPQPVRAFSLLELLIVMALVLVAFTLYWGGGFSTSRAKFKACEKNLQAIFFALKAYSTDNNGKFPVMSSAKTSEPVLSMLIPRCTTSASSFVCPGSSDKPLPDAKPFANARISYAYYMGLTAADSPDQPLASDRQVNTNSKTIGQLIFSPSGKKPGNNHNKSGGVIVFGDGSTQFSPSGSAFNLTNGPNVVLLNPKP